MGELSLSREMILAYRRRTGWLEERLPRGPDALRGAAWAGLADSVPRAALLSIHARVRHATPSAWQDPALVQLWGPRFSAYVVAAQDRAVFSLGRLPVHEGRRRFAHDLAERLDGFLDGREMPYGQAGRALGEHPNQLRYAATTGRVLIRWDGARQPLVRTVPLPEMGAGEARLELARRYLHVLGPATMEGFARWAGVHAKAAGSVFDTLRPELTPVRTDVGDSWILTHDEPVFRAPPVPPASARLLPSGDTYFLLHGPDRALLLQEAAQRAALWTPRVWPGAVLVNGDVVGTWRRSEEKVTVSPWRTLPAGAREAVELEAAALPIPRLQRPITVRWDE